MKFRYRLLNAVLVSALAISLLSGCNLIEVDKVKEGQEVVAKVGDQVITRNDFKEQYDVYAYQYGMEFEDQSEENLNFKEQVLDILIEQKIREAKAAEMGLNTFTDEDRAEAQKRVDENMQANYDSAYEYYNSLKAQDDSIDPVKLATAYRDAMVETYPNDMRLEEELKKIADERMVDEICKDLSISDEEVKTAYDAQLKEAKEKYEAQPNAYYTEFSTPTTDETPAKIYVPGGYNYVKHILIKFDDDTMSQLTDLRTSAKAAGDGLTGEEAEKAIAESEDTKKADEMRKTALTGIQAKADEVLAKVQADPSKFDELMAEYGEDPGMQREPMMSNGYAVIGTMTNMAKEFVDASMALANDGDISGLVASDNGYHIIKRVGHSVETTRSLEEMTDTIRASLLADARNAKMDEVIKEWTDATKITKHIDRVKK